MQRALSFKSSPPLAVPLRLLLTAPVFVLLAALLLLWAGPTALSSRWTPAALALTHLFTIGALAMTMAGALMQILPVATGTTMLAPRATSLLVHASLGLGTLALAAGFLWRAPALFLLAAILLSTGLGWLVAACLGGLWQHRAKATKGSREILIAIRLAMIALLITASLGLILAGSLAWSMPAPRHLTGLHGTWGLLGWVGLLITGIAYQVIPMFQVTELYPKPVTRWLTLAVFALLVAYTASVTGKAGIAPEAGKLLTVLLLTAYTIFAAATFYLLWTRKRPKADTTTLFWRTAMLSLAACGPTWLWQTAYGVDLSVALGMLFIVGFAWSAVNGMLYKILPFLLWYHAQKDLQIALPVVPKVKQIIPDHIAMRQYWAHLVALTLLLAASLRPNLTSHAAALALGISSVWLGINMLGALRLFREAQRKIALALESAGQP